MKIFIIYDMADYDVLKKLGLSKTGIRCYTNLLEQGPATARRLAARLKIPHTNIYGILEKLEEEGFVNKFKLVLSSALYIARPPDQAIEENYANRRRRVLSLCRELRLAPPRALPPPGPIRPCGVLNRVRK